jgi:hypothetical protein
MPEQMTEQMEEWVGKFGEEYVDRNITSPEEFDNLLYRGNNELLWKTNFAELYLDRFPDLQLVKERKYPYLEDKKLVDLVFFVEKRVSR